MWWVGKALTAPAPPSRRTARRFPTGPLRYIKKSVSLVMCVSKQSEVIVPSFTSMSRCMDKQSPASVKQ